MTRHYMSLRWKR